MPSTVAEAAMAFVFGLASGVVPVLNVELYLLGLGTLGGGTLLMGAAAAGLGQTLGKIPYFYIGRGALNVPWLKRRARTPPRWAERAERWRAKAEGRPLWALGLVGVSSLASVPPFMVVSVLAGTVRMPVWSFAAVTFVTRTVRFAVVVYAPGAALWLL